LEYSENACSYVAFNWFKSFRRLSVLVMPICISCYQRHVTVNSDSCHCVCLW